MKVINQKGKLFGLINIVDLIVLVLIIAAGISVFKLKGDTAANPLAGNNEITYTVKVEGVQPEVLADIENHLPSQLMAAGKLLDGEVVSVESSPAVLTTSDEDGNVLQSVDNSKKDLVFTINATMPADSVSMELGTQEIRTGKSHIVKTKYFELTGTILSVDTQS